VILFCDRLGAAQIDDQKIYIKKRAGNRVKNSLPLVLLYSDKREYIIKAIPQIITSE